jgi:hypothetical protein
VLDIVALLATNAGRIALLLGSPERWQREPGCTLIPIELPAGTRAPGTALEQAIATVGQRWLRTDARPLAHEWRYGPSARHAVDRAPASAGDVPAPLVLVPRLVPDDAAPTGARQLVVGIFHVALAGEPQLGGESAGLLWLPLEALRPVVRGLPLADALAHEDVRLVVAPGHELPDDAMVFLPADYGERYLLRVLAKYDLRAMLRGK